MDSKCPVKVLCGSARLTAKLPHNEVSMKVCVLILVNIVISFAILPLEEIIASLVGHCFGLECAGYLDGLSRAICRAGLKRVITVLEVASTPSRILVNVFCAFVPGNDG